PVHQQVADPGGVALQVVVEDVVDHRVAAGRGERVPAEGGETDRVDRVHHLGPAHHTGQGQPVAHALGEGEQVRGDAVCLVPPEVLAGTAPAGLYLVGDEQHTELVEHLAVPGEQAVRRVGVPAHSLDRFGDQARDVTTGRGGEELAQVGDGGVDELVVGAAGEYPAQPVAGVQEADPQPGQRRGRPAAYPGRAEYRERAPVVAAAQREDLVAAPVVRGDEQRRLVGLAAGVGEEHPRVRDAGQPGDLLGQLDLRADQVQRRG